MLIFNRSEEQNLLEEGFFALSNAQRLNYLLNSDSKKIAEYRLSGSVTQVIYYIKDLDLPIVIHCDGVSEVRPFVHYKHFGEGSRN